MCARRCATRYIDIIIFKQNLIRSEGGGTIAAAAAATSAATEPLYRRISMQTAVWI